MFPPVAVLLIEIGCCDIGAPFWSSAVTMYACAAPMLTVVVSGGLSVKVVNVCGTARIRPWKVVVSVVLLGVPPAGTDSCDAEEVTW